ncbi:hypothetical protein [Moritella yayanosii]|uniref:Uncharacterized protein n=1 Tax=Moritella yayanosii TaxID=69539 RepID=A0A330LPV3_9GAMM|nr:hypothetical protein [Moritella yayanosii]SQD78743.1 protein of unknown function [Moritella yayanosii]
MGKKKWKDRKLGEWVETLVKGDVIVFPENLKLDKLRPDIGFRSE